jgi:hypothetical protein
MLPYSYFIHSELNTLCAVISRDALITTSPLPFLALNHDPGVCADDDAGFAMLVVGRE